MSQTDAPSPGATTLSVALVGPVLTRGSWVTLFWAVVTSRTERLSGLTMGRVSTRRLRTGVSAPVVGSRSNHMVLSDWTYTLTPSGLTVSSSAPSSPSGTVLAPQSVFGAC